ncbi:hypothetical protein AGMMS4957_01830 [Bacteroidia bacterium]|nr:hypothetical protein AGMMS4957_01830 [Bacteroidia bacterium]
METAIQTQVMETSTQTEQLRGVEYDANGEPVGISVPEWFDILDKKLIDRFGEEYRILANESRTEWNKQGLWTFNYL